METTRLAIKNMVCNRCIKVVKDIIEETDLIFKNGKLGSIEVEGEVDKLNYEILRQKLSEVGFELMDDKKAQLIEKIKNTIIRIIHHTDALDVNINFSYILQEEIQKDYQHLSTLFSSTESITIEKFIILQRIERVKEFLIYNELTLSEIAFKLGYSSVQHLSSQFKKVTGLTPSDFKNLKNPDRTALDQIK